MNRRDDFNLIISEIHHTSKIDSPSGTAIKIKEDIESIIKKEISIESKRIGQNKGTHKKKHNKSRKNKKKHTKIIQQSYKNHVKNIYKSYTNHILRL